MSLNMLSNCGLRCRWCLHLVVHSGSSGLRNDSERTFSSGSLMFIHLFDFSLAVLCLAPWCQLPPLVSPSPFAFAVMIKLTDVLLTCWPQGCFDWCESWDSKTMWLGVNQNITQLIVCVFLKNGEYSLLPGQTYHGGLKLQCSWPPTDVPIKGVIGRWWVTSGRTARCSHFGSFTLRWPYYHVPAGMPVCFHQTGSGFQTVIHNYKQTEAAPIMVENSSDPPLWNGIPPPPYPPPHLLSKLRWKNPIRLFLCGFQLCPLAIPGF